MSFVKTFVGFCLLCINSFSSAQMLTLFDSHSHYKLADAQYLSASDVIGLMDQFHISHMLLIGEPAELVQRVYQTAPERIVPFLGIYDEVIGKANWMNDSNLPERVRQQLAQGYYAGLGEIHLFADDRHNRVFHELLKIAHEQQLPLLFHGDAEVIDEIFNAYPDLTVIWAHLGTDPLPVLLRRMLTQYPQHLYIDTSVRDERLLVDGRLRKDFKQLFIDYPERFLVAIDTFYTPRWQNLEQVTRLIRQWLTDLPVEVARKLAAENARRLFFGASRVE